MELRHLRYFVAVAETENVTQAAAQLNLSQPPLSRQIRELEDFLGVALFYRHGKSIRLTQPGRLFLRKAKTILKQIEQVVEAVRKADGENKEHLHIGYVPSFASKLLPEILRAYKAEAPSVRVTLHDMTHIEMINGLRSFQLDAALIGRYSPKPFPGIKFDLLGSFRAGVLTSLQHPFAGRESIQLEEVFPERLVLFSRRHYAVHFNWVRSLLGTRLKAEQIESEVDSGASMIAAVDSGRGIAICTEGHAQLAGSRVRFIPFHPAQTPAEIGIAYSNRVALPVETLRFINTATSLPLSLFP